MTQDITVWQRPDGKEWEERIIKRINNAIIYIPRDTTRADQMVTLDRRKLINYVEAEGYGK